MAMVASFCLIVWAQPSKAQTVYISTLGGPVPSSVQVQGAISKWTAALSISIPFAGSTALPCVNGAITYRIPSTSEWLAVMGSPRMDKLAATFACRPELNYTGSVILLNPFTGNPTDRIYAHELGHALGAHHVSNTLALMYESPSVDTPISDDIQSVADCVVWSEPTGVIHIPATSASQKVILTPNNGKWYVTSVASTSYACEFNYQLPNGDYELFEVLAWGGRYGVVLTQGSDGGWSVRSASQY